MYTPAKEQPKGGFDIGYLVAGQEIQVWPENWAVLGLFSKMGTQWRVGMSGPIGLDYNILFRLLDQIGLSQEDWQIYFDDMRVMESTALSAMRNND